MLPIDCHFHRMCWAGALGWLVMIGPGCSGSGAGTTTRSGQVPGRQIRLPQTPPDRVFEAGVYAMQQWFRRVEPRPALGVIYGSTTEYTQEGGTDRIRDVIGFRNRMRRTGSLTVQPFGEGTRVACRVDRERLDTADHRVFRQNRSLNDLPNQTPIERDAGLMASQEQVWTRLSRDRPLEMDILDLIRDRTAGMAGADAAAEDGSDIPDR